jgi:hypothetical protein
MMFEELMFHPFFRGEKDAMACSWLIVISLSRDDVPWLYEPGMDFYRALQKRKPQEIQRARDFLVRLIKFTNNSKFMYRFLRENEKDSVFLMRRLDEFIDRFVPKTVSEEELEEDDKREINRKED